MTTSAPRWSSDLGFMLGAVGAAVGLGSIWRFPYLAGAGGGFAFIVVFVIACLVFGAPVLIAETLLGRWSRDTPQQSARVLAGRFGYHGAWSWVGWVGPVAGFIVVSYYTMIAGWVLAYAVDFLLGRYSHGATAAVARFHSFTADSRSVSLWQLAFCALVGLTSARGVNRGVELANRLRPPALLALLLVLGAYSLTTGDVARGLHFAFAPDLSRLTPAVVLGAVGQACFALGISAGIIVAYGSYMPSGEPVGRSVLAVIGSILIVSLLATIVIFPLVFRYGLDPAAGVDLVFQVLPVAFAQMPGGRVIGTLFFSLLVLAAFTPSIGLLEPWIVHLMRRAGLGRGSAVWVVLAATWIVGQASVLSFGRLKELHLLAFWPRFAGQTPFELLDYVASSVLMPLSALVISVFVGWRLGRHIPPEELPGFSMRQRAVLLLALRFVCPVGLAIVLLAGIAS